MSQPDQKKDGTSWRSPDRREAIRAALRGVKETKPEGSMQACSRCHQQIEAAARFCPHCGYDTKPEPLVLRRSWVGFHIRRVILTVLPLLLAGGAAFFMWRYIERDSDRPAPPPPPSPVTNHMSAPPPVLDPGSLRGRIVLSDESGIRPLANVPVRLLRQDGGFVEEFEAFRRQTLKIQVDRAAPGGSAALAARDTIRTEAARMRLFNRFASGVYVSDSNGVFVADGVPPGAYAVTAEGTCGGTAVLWFERLSVTPRKETAVTLSSANAGGLETLYEIDGRGPVVDREGYRLPVNPLYELTAEAYLEALRDSGLADEDYALKL